MISVRNKIYCRYVDYSLPFYIKHQEIIFSNVNPVLIGNIDIIMAKLGTVFADQIDLFE